MIKKTLAACLLLGASTAHAEPRITAAERAAIDRDAVQTLRLTGVPAASIAIVRDGAIIYTHAYGLAQITPPRPATPATVFGIGSVSKQFTAALVLLLAQDGKLSLDDTVGRFFPQLTDADHITIRELLAHTSGYEDCWPEDYFTLDGSKPTTPLALVTKWATKKLDFPPGTDWQYSNTGYTLAALIAEKAGGAPFFDQLQKRILRPLHLSSAVDYSQLGVPKGGAIGYERYAYGPPRPAPLDQPGTTLGSATLAMNARDLALWDISLINQTILSPASYKTMETEQKLPGGKGTDYGLGLEVLTRNGHRILAHSGEDTGYVSDNLVLPDDRDAVVVLTNQDASRAAGVIASEISQVAFGLAPKTPSDPATALVLSELRGLAAGTPDMSHFTDNLKYYFSPRVLADYRTSLSALGPILGLKERAHENRGGMVNRDYEAIFADRQVSISTYEMPDGKLDQLLIVP